MLVESSALCLLEMGLFVKSARNVRRGKEKLNWGPSFKMWKWKWQARPAWQGSINNARASQSTSLL
jgi:hypothetical protein